MNAVTATDLEVAYGTTVALGQSTFSIPRGLITSVIGPNGSGKSTLLATIAGLIEPVGGSVTLSEGVSRVAYVMQTTKVNEVLPVTVAEVVTMGRFADVGFLERMLAKDKAAVSEAMERMDILDIASSHLHELSGGQRQRVFVAQGLAQEHDLLLLDEPLTGIDLPTAQAIDDIIHDETSRGCTVVLTTHDLSEARVSDYVLLLSGRVVASGAPSEVLTSENLAAAYGESLLHVEHDTLFVDDPAHTPVPGRHTHRERTIDQTP